MDLCSIEMLLYSHKYLFWHHYSNICKFDSYTYITTGELDYCLVMSNIVPVCSPVVVCCNV